MIDRELTIDKIRDEIIKFKNDPDFQKLENFYYSKSLPEILGVSRREISHSGFIAWLLDNSESHGLSYYPLRKFLDILLKFSNDQQKQQYKDLFDSFVTDDYSVKHLLVKSEYAIKSVGRIDIYLELVLLVSGKELTLKLIIENKVHSKENNDQTNTYFKYFEQNRLEGEIVIYVYLTPISTLELIELTEPECSCKQFIQINYQALVDFLLEPALNQNISLKTKNIIIEYLQSLSQPSINDETEGHKQELIMALGSEERKLLSNFWNKNQKLILSALYAISSDPEQDKEVRDSINEALDNLSPDKDRSTFNILYDGALYIGGFKKSDIGYQTIKLLEEKGLINRETINFLKLDKSCSFSLLKKKEDFTETEVKYRKYKYNGEPELIFDTEEFYVARNWGKDNVGKFINKFSQKFPGLKYEQMGS